jgi:DHA1 family inner membrane transport protein
MGNALGAFLGGVAIGLGLGFLASVWVGVALALLGLVIAVVSLRLERSRMLVAA